MILIKSFCIGNDKEAFFIDSFANGINIIHSDDNNKGKTIAASSHGGVIRCLVCRLIENDINKLKDISWSENTAVMLIEFDDDFKANLVYFNDYSHLPEEFVNRKTRLASFMRGNAK